MSAIAAKDWREFVRDRRLVIAAGLMLVLALLALALSWQRVASHEADRAAAEAGDRQTWLEQGEQNPHGAAHFASWAFRPLTPTAPPPRRGIAGPGSNRARRTLTARRISPAGPSAR